MSGTIDNSNNNNHNNNAAAISSLALHQQQVKQEEDEEQQQQQQHHHRHQQQQEAHTQQQHQHQQQQQQQHQLHQQSQQPSQQYQHPLHQLQQQAHTHVQPIPLGPAPPGQSPTGASVGGDSLTCQWLDCGERCLSAEQLYEHVCERHVGRKSTNNLNLICQWGNCRTATIKRDHITSHIRVHVPLKPHKCDFCGKAFKRPQDLKKHVKTHADDSVLLRSPDPNNAARGMPTGAFPDNTGKLDTDLRTLAATATGYYSDNQVGHGGAYPHPGVAGPAAYYNSGPPPPGSSYGPVYYAVNQPPGGMDAQLESKKRAAVEALNDFFGDVKRRNIDPRVYYDVSQRLAALQPHQLPLLTGYGMGEVGVPEYQQTLVAAAQAYHSMPLSSLRTKADLVSVDQYLDQLQATIYESANQVAAAGVNQAPSSNRQSAHMTGTAPLAQMTSSTATDTPALTPASSIYTSAQSPNVVETSQNLSPGSRSNVYPNLPNVSSVSDNGYLSSNGLSASAPATSFAESSRRFSGVDDNNQTLGMPMTMAMSGNSSAANNRPDSRRVSDQHGLRQGVKQIALSPLAVDPSLRSPTQQSDASTAGGAGGANGSGNGGGGAGGENVNEREQETWVENMRTIEFLRQLVKDRLERGEFEHDVYGGANGNLHQQQQQHPHQQHSHQHQQHLHAQHQHQDNPEEQRRELSEAERDAQSLYPVLRAVEGSD